MSADTPTPAPEAFDLWRRAASETDRDEKQEEETAPAPAEVEDAPAADHRHSTLPHEARRALVYLLKKGVILYAEKRLLFEALCRYRAGIEQQLENMYLRLLVDDKAGIALLRQQETSGDDEDGEMVALITPRTLTLYDTLLLLVLRKHYQERETSGERRVVIDLEQIEARLTPFLPLTNNSRLERKMLTGALGKLKDRKIVAGVRGEDERYEITPAIRYLVSADFLRQLLDEYRKLAASAQNPGDADDE
ncbi:DUF4194 domain-containing protein [Microbulbifer sp.]|uniref:DUF4194 domain-containing protein n=1 Tax=Microbulbifer sp. TaxID=1908541 RepID=UPI003F34EE7E